MTAAIIPLKVSPPAVKQRAPRKRASRSLRTPTRKELLDQLRRESKERAGTRYSFQDKSLLVELASAAANYQGRSITWRGIRFPLRHGLWLVVLDPQTGEPLISTHGGIL